MELLPKEIAAKLPKLYATEDVPEKEKVAHLKLFDPCGVSWYTLEHGTKTALRLGQS